MSRLPVLLLLVGVLRVRASGIVVLANDAALTAVKAGDLDFGVTSGCGNNHPERRRNILIDSLVDMVVGASSDGDLSAAALVHSVGFAHYFETAFERWRTELSSDASYLMPGCLLYTSPSPRDGLLSRMPSSA